MWLWSFGLLWNSWPAFGTSAPLLWISGILSASLFSPKGCSVHTPPLLFNSPCLQQSCGSGVLADGRLADLIRRVATFGMVLMKLDLRQVWFIFYVYHCLSNQLWPETSHFTGIWETCRNAWCNYNVFGYGYLQWMGWRKETGILNKRTQREEATSSC